MSEFDFNPDDYSSDDVVGYDNGDAFVQEKLTWLKMTKQQKMRVAFVYFDTVDVNAVSKARALAKKEGRALTVDEMKAVALKALKKRADELQVKLEDLQPEDRLDLSDAKFKAFKAHYEDGSNNSALKGYVVSRLGKDGPESDAVWKRLDEPRQYYSTLLLVYPINNKGEVDVGNLADGWRLIPWRMSQKMYEKIWDVSRSLRENNLSLAGQDHELVCTESEYQDIKIVFKTPVVWQKHPKFKKLVLNEALKLYDQLIPFREMTTAQLRQKLGLDSPEEVADVNPTDGFNAFLDNA
jgi:hypothetical protein